MRLHDELKSLYECGSNTQLLEQRIADFFTLSDEHKKARVLLDNWPVLSGQDFWRDGA